MKFLIRQQRGQTLLEYVMLLVVLVIPVTAAIRTMMEDQDEEGKKKNLLFQVVRDSYGENGRLGAIGRPYP